MSAYYNEIDPYAAQWLRNLIAEGLIAPGEVDERSIEDVRPDDLRGFAQCHFFAGIGVWSRSLRMAGWPDDRPVWTGSCPCQPFSAAGKGDGFADERHLWPAFHHLIRERRPAVVFGEQVASKDADPWIDLVQDDLEALGYAVGAVPFPSAGVGAPHIRDRLYWVGYAVGTRLEGLAGDGYDWLEPGRDGAQPGGPVTASGTTGGMADPDGEQLYRGGNVRARRWSEHSDRSSLDGASSAVNGFWRDADWLSCRDGKWRPVEPGAFPLAHGIANRVGRLRAYGNAICAEAAVEFIKVAMDYRP